MAVSDTSICNMALARIGAKRITAIDTDATIEAIQCRQHYSQSRDWLLRNHNWRFAITRATLSEDATAPAFEWDNQFIIPADCLRVLCLYDRDSEYVVEGDRILTDDTTAYLVYIKQVTDPTQFDVSFAECLVLDLARRLVMPLANDKTLAQLLGQELTAALSRARVIDGKEAPQSWAGQSWNDSRDTGTVIPKQVTP